MEHRLWELRWLCTMIVLCTVALCLTGLPAVFTDPVPHTFSTLGFYALELIAQNFLFSCAMGIILLPFLLCIQSTRWKVFFSIVFVAATLIVCFSNVKVYSFWRFYINTTMLHLLLIGGTKVFECPPSMYVWIGMMVLLFLGAATLLVLLTRKFQAHFNLKYFLQLFIFIYVVTQCLFLFFCLQNNMRFLQYTMKVPYFYNVSWVNALQKMGVPVFPDNALTTEFQTIVNSDDKKLNYPLHPLQYHLPAHPLNVLLIVIDTLRYDMVNPVNMPNVMKFSTHANQFLDNLSGGDCTRPGIFSLFYGIPATYWRAVEEQHRSSILIRAFQDNHYQLGVFASAPLTSPPFADTVFAGVKHLQLTTPGDTALDRDAKITEETQAFLNNAGKNHKPFFGFVFYDAPHAYNALNLKRPFHPAKHLNYFSVTNKTSPTPMYNMYKNAVYADDQLVEKIFASLKKDHLDKNTVVIITADHGQEFNEYHNDYWEHASGFSRYQIRTPMLIRWPNKKPALFHDQTTHFDLTPTLLKRVLGVSNPASDYSVGQDFFLKKQIKSVIVANYAYYALIAPRDIMIFHHSGLYRMVDLKMNPLPVSHPAFLVRNHILDEMKRWYY